MAQLSKSGQTSYVNGNLDVEGTIYLQGGILVDSVNEMVQVDPNLPSDITVNNSLLKLRSDSNEAVQDMKLMVPTGLKERASKGGIAYDFPEKLIMYDTTEKKWSISNTSDVVFRIEKDDGTIPENIFTFEDFSEIQFPFKAKDMIAETSTLIQVVKVAGYGSLKVGDQYAKIGNDYYRYEDRYITAEDKTKFYYKENLLTKEA